MPLENKNKEYKLHLWVTVFVLVAILYRRLSIFNMEWHRSGLKLPNCFQK